MAYKMDNLRYGAMDDSYIDSMSEANQNSQDAVRWKLLADQAMKDDSLNSTNEGDAYRQKELLAVRARKKKIAQEIDELKKELQQRTQLQAYEDRYKDSPMWKLAKKQYIDTGDLSSIESFVTRENALEEAMKARDFTSRENEMNRQNTLELNKAQKAEQLEYELDGAQEKVELALNKLQSEKALGNPTDIKNAQITYNYAVKSLNKIREKIGMEASDYKEEPIKSDDKSSVNEERSIVEIISGIPKDYRYKTKAEKEKILKEISEHPAYKLKNEELLKAYTAISNNTTSEELNEKNTSDKEKAEKLWNGLGRREKYNYMNGIISYDSTNPNHKLLKNFESTFGIKWR